MTEVNTRAAGRAASCIGACVLAGLLTAGCGGNPISSLLGGGGSSAREAAPVLASGPRAAPAEPDAGDPVICPKVEVIDGGASVRLGASGDGARAQLTLGDIARECTPRAGGGYALKVGVEVAALLGAGGAAGRYDANLRVIVRRGGRVIASRVKRAAISMPAGDTRGSALVVEEGIIVLAGDADEELDILVGLEGGGTPSGRRR